MISRKGTMNGQDFEDILRLVDLEPSAKMYEAMQMVNIKTMVENSLEREKSEKQKEIIEPDKAQQFVDSFTMVATRVAEIANKRGFYKTYRNDSQDIALMHGELSEVLEYMRNGNPPSSAIPEFSGVEENFADVIIRIMSYSSKYGHAVAAALIAKMKFNSHREPVGFIKVF